MAATVLLENFIRFDPLHLIVSDADGDDVDIQTENDFTMMNVDNVITALYAVIPDEYFNHKF